MSRSSFPRPEHARLLREGIATRLQTCSLQLELSERGLDQYRCCYRFGIRRPADSDWAELPVHFQVAERMEASRSDDELSQILKLFLERNFTHK